jgi:hypothetical protein
MQILDNIGSLPFISWAISMKLSDANLGQYWLSTVYFLGDFNETFRLLFFSCPSTDVPSFSLKNIQK